MDDVADGLHSAWKETLRGLKEGYKMTKKALKKIPIIDSKGHGGSAGELSHSERRRMFQAKYASPSPSRGAAHRQEEDSSDAESSDSEILSNEQVKGLVDGRFFDPDFDALTYEAEHLPEECPKEEEAIRAESALVDQKILVLRQQCNVVSSTLKKRVLAHHQDFVKGIEEMRLLNESLFTTSSDCKKCRAAVKKAKANVVVHLEVVAHKRAVENIRSTLDAMTAMDKMMRKRTQLRALLARGKVMDAARFLKKEQEIEMEDTLQQITCMTEILEEWRSFVQQPKKLQESIEDVLNTCFTQTFMHDAYQNVVESAYQLSSSAECCSTVETLLWETAVHIFTRSLTDLSTVKDETAALADIVIAVEPELLGMCLNNIAAKWMDFFYVFATVRSIHHDAVHETDTSDPLGSSGASYSDDDGERTQNTITVHRDLLERVHRLGPRLARDLMMKLILIMSSCCGLNHFVETLNADHLVHLFVILDLVVEGMVVALDPDAGDVKRTKTELMDLLCTALHRGAHLPHMHELIQSMNNDSWDISDMSVTSISVLKPLSSAYYDSLVQMVRRYLSLDPALETTLTSEENSSFTMTGAGTVRQMRENPFRLPCLLQPQDTSGLVESITFGQYWGTVKMNQTTEAKGSSVSPPTIIAGSAIKLYNMLMTNQLTMVVRFPPLVDRVLGWCEEAVSFYLFTVIDNFVSISRSIPVEDQGDYSVAAQKILRDLRRSAECALDARDGFYAPLTRHVDAASSSPTTASPLLSSEKVASLKFPPRVIDRIRSLFVSAGHQYALGCRAVACESSRAVVALYECVVRSFEPLLGPGGPDVLQYYLTRCDGMYFSTIESLHVCLHRLSEAIVPLTKACEDIAHLRVKKDEVEVSPYVREVLKELRDLHTQRYPMPTPDLETLFIQRSIFAVQCVMLREYSKLSKKMNDLLAMQLQVDAQNFAQQAAVSFGKANVVLPRYVLTLVKTGFFLQDSEQGKLWMEQEHAGYNAADVLNWFSRGDRTTRTELEVYLKRDLKHVDCLSLKGFFHAPS